MKTLIMSFFILFSSIPLFGQEALGKSLQYIKGRAAQNETNNNKVTYHYSNGFTDDGRFFYIVKSPSYANCYFFDESNSCTSITRVIRDNNTLKMLIAIYDYKYNKVNDKMWIHDNNNGTWLTIKLGDMPHGMKGFTMANIEE